MNITEILPLKVYPIYLRMRSLRNHRTLILSPKWWLIWSSVTHYLNRRLPPLKINSFITGPLTSLFLRIHLFSYDFQELLSLIYRGVVLTSDEVAVSPLAFSSESTI